MRLEAPVTVPAPWLEPMLDQLQRYQAVAWFLYGWMEREQRLNMQACGAWWLRAPGPRRSAKLEESGLTEAVAAPPP